MWISENQIRFPNHIAGISKIYIRSQYTADVWDTQ